MTHRVTYEQYKAIMRRNGARGGTVSAERKAALARATLSWDLTGLEKLGENEKAPVAREELQGVRNFSRRRPALHDQPRGPRD